MGKKKRKVAGKTDVLIAVPRSCEKEVRELVKEHRDDADKKKKPLNREKLLSENDEARVRDAERLLKQLRKPIQAVRRLHDDLDDVGLDSIGVKAMSKDDEKWLDAQCKRLATILDAIDDL
jgi:hypothetical protein